MLGLRGQTPQQLRRQPFEFPVPDFLLHGNDIVHALL